MNPWTRIPFELPAVGPVRITIYDVGGRQVRVLLEGRSLEAGPHVIHWDGRNGVGQPVGTGTYYIRLQAASGEDAGAITLLR
jgi:flagellar hook assembly protein FlgD